MTLENSKDLSLETSIIDFEVGLMNYLGKIFNKIRASGCYYDYDKIFTRKLKS